MIAAYTLVIKQTERNQIGHYLFITEGDSASGSLVKSQECTKHRLYFSFGGKPLNCYGMSKKIVYEKKSLSLAVCVGYRRWHRKSQLQSWSSRPMPMSMACIRLLLLLTFMVQFLDLVRNGPCTFSELLYSRVRDKIKRSIAIANLKNKTLSKIERGKPEITGFKGLGRNIPK